MTINYEEIEVETASGIEKHIVIDNGDGSFKTFAANEDNPEYVSFLEALEEDLL